MSVFDSIKAGLGSLVVDVENVNFSQLASILSVAQTAEPLIEQGVVAIEDLVSTTKAALTGQGMTTDEFNNMVATIQANSAKIQSAGDAAQAEIDAEAAAAGGTSS